MNELGVRVELLYEAEVLLLSMGSCIISKFNNQLLKVKMIIENPSLQSDKHMAGLRVVSKQKISFIFFRGPQKHSVRRNKEPNPLLVRVARSKKALALARSLDRFKKVCVPLGTTKPSIPLGSVIWDYTCLERLGLHPELFIGWLDPQ